MASRSASHNFHNTSGIGHDQKERARLVSPEWRIFFNIVQLRLYEGQGGYPRLELHRNTALCGLPAKHGFSTLPQLFS
jgi:hypothetical protein